MPAPGSARRSPGGWVAHLWRTLHRELGKFGVIGAVAYVVDVGLFNLLSYGVADAGGWLGHKPLTAKVVSVGVATLVAWMGNRWWTYRSQRAAVGRAALPELLLFLAMNVAALLISLACLGFAVYVLGLRSPVAANISANIIGVGLATVFRFYAYRTWVFRHHPAPAAPPVPEAPAVPAAPAAAVVTGAAVPMSKR